METREITYFDSEGRANYPEVLKIVAARAKQNDVQALVLFSATNQGAADAAKKLVRGKNPPLIVVTYRAEAANVGEDEEGELVEVPIGIDEEGEAQLKQRDVRLVRAALPFSNEIIVLRYGDPKLSGIREALKLISGGLHLVIQGVLLACDAGYIREKQRVVAFSADTAIVARAAHTDTLFFPDRGLEIQEILCKPSRLTVVRPETEEFAEEPCE